MTSPILAPRGVHDVLAWRAAVTPDALAFAFLGDDLTEQGRLTYAQLHERALAIGAALRGTVAPKSQVLVLLAPGLDYIASIFGCFYAGAVAVSAAPPSPVHLDRALPRLRAIIADAGVTGILSTAPIQRMVDASGVLTRDGDPVTWLRVEELTEAPARDGVGPRLATAPGLAPIDAGGLDDLAFFQYTSGSTASPRGVMLSHRNLLVNSEAIATSFGNDSGSVVFSWLPPYHDMGFLGTILQPVYVGAPCYFTSPVTVIRRPIRWIQAMSRFKATFSGGPNFMYDLCVARCQPGDLDGIDLSQWRVAVNGAEQVRAATLESFAATFGPAGFRAEALTPAYGLAEASLLLATSGANPPTIIPFDAETLRTVGFAVPGVGDPLVSSGQAVDGHHLIIVDPDTGDQLADGAVGEVWAAGPSVAQGYWHNPAATEAAFHGQLADEAGTYLRTGDLGFLLRGELFITGRRKEVIIINGANYHPHDLEVVAEGDDQALRAHCSAAFTVDDGSGAQLHLVMEIARGEHDPAVVERTIDQIRGRVAAGTGLTVDVITLVPPRAVPKTTSGKIQRLRSREALLAGEFEIVAQWRREAATNPSGVTP